MFSSQKYSGKLQKIFIPPEGSPVTARAHCVPRPSPGKPQFAFSLSFLIPGVLYESFARGLAEMIKAAGIREFTSAVHLTRL